MMKIHFFIHNTIFCLSDVLSGFNHSRIMHVFNGQFFYGFYLGNFNKNENLTNNEYVLINKIYQ